jgi:hypothetical protein
MPATPTLCFPKRRTDRRNCFPYLTAPPALALLLAAGNQMTGDVYYFLPVCFKRLPHIVLSKSSINGGSGLVGMIQYPADKVQAVSCLCQPRSNSATKVMQSHVLNFCGLPDTPPDLFYVHQMRTGTFTGDYVGIIVGWFYLR